MTKKKPGPRPVFGEAMTAAERARRYRRKKASTLALAVTQLLPTDPQDGIHLGMEGLEALLKAVDIPENPMRELGREQIDAMLMARFEVEVFGIPDPDNEAVRVMPEAAHLLSWMQEE